MSRKSALLQRIEYAAYRAVAMSVRHASDDTLNRWGTRLGHFARVVLRRRDRLAMRNLRYVFPEKPETELRTILNECWAHFGRQALSYIPLQNMPLDEVRARAGIENGHILDEAIARGKGVIIISAHYGSWEAGGLAMMSLMKNVRAVARRLDNEYLERDLAQIRARSGVQLLDRRKAGRSLMKALSEKAVVILLPDQAVQPREGILVNFMGRKAWTTPAPAKMAVRHGTTIVFAFCIPEGARHRLQFEDSIDVGQLSGDEKSAEALTERINDVISRRIAARPELWLWMHDRWKGTKEAD